MLIDHFDAPQYELEAGRVLHAGCGMTPLPPWLRAREEVRLDIYPGCKPDVVASMTDLGDIGTYDVVFCGHALEHMYYHDIVRALEEFHRVLVPGGMLYVEVPDCEGVMPTHDVLYHCNAGPVTGIDLLYGFQIAIRALPHMAHRFGFVADTLAEALREAGFRHVRAMRQANWNLVGIGVRGEG